MTTQLENLERLRQNLEANIAKLRTSLQYWQTWEIEYESFKEELERHESEPTTEQMLAIGVDLELDIVDDKEIKSLLKYGARPSRTREQVIGQLRGRIDTGVKNVESVMRQLAQVEAKLEKVVMVEEDEAQGTGLGTTSGDHLMDIVEELDDDGNVVSSRVVDASKDRQKLQEVLMKKGLVEEKPEETANDDDAPPRKETKKDKGKKVAFAEQPSYASQEQELAAAAAAAAAASSSTPLSVPQEQRALASNKMHPTQRMLVLDDHDNVIDSKPLELVHPRPNTEDEEIAYLREARANAQEIAPIVASFDIEPDSDDSDMDTDMDDADSENEYGMSSIGAELTDDYKQQMEELMKKHAVAMENAGPNYNPDVLQKLENAHRDAAIVIKGDAKVQETEKSTPHSTGKGVRFAEDLDISKAVSEPKTSTIKDAPATEHEKASNPVSDAILERGSETQNTPTRLSATRKPSKFKTSMNTAANRLAPMSDETASKEDGVVVPSITTQEETSLPERPKKMSRFKAAKMQS